YIMNILAQLGGTMAGKGKRQFLSRHSRAVIANPDQVEPASRRRDLDPASSRIDGVLDQLLDDAGRALHHFAGGNLVDHRIGKSANAHPAIIADSRLILLHCAAGQGGPGSGAGCAVLLPEFLSAEPAPSSSGGLPFSARL